MRKRGSSKEINIIQELDRFIKDCEKGKRLKKNGSRMRKETIDNYRYLKVSLEDFVKDTGFQLRLKTLTGNNRRVFEQEKRYWKKFHYRFTSYLYKDKDLYDNYVGHICKLLRSLFNYIQSERGYNIGYFHRNFHVVKEDIQIIALQPERLRFLINDEDFDASLSKKEREVKDICVFGSTVALRYGDLMTLTKRNLTNENNGVYLNVRASKTQVLTRIRLPHYCLEIIEKYKRNNGQKLLPVCHPNTFRKQIRKIAEKAGWTEPVPKIRSKRGIPVEIYTNKKTRKPYRFCDLLATHTMRRTGISTYLSLGIKEEIVRGISGHAPGSKEFWRYVSYTQGLIDKEMDMVYEKLATADHD